MVSALLCYRLSVRLSVTRMDQPITVEVMIMKFIPHGSPVRLVFASSASSRNSNGFPQVGTLNKGGWVKQAIF